MSTGVASKGLSTVRYRLDDLVIDLERQRVERDGERLSVAGLSFQLLRHLVEQGDRVVGFDELIQRVWAPAVVSEETVTQRVKLLRQALGDDGRSPRYLRSVRGQGYQLCVRPYALPGIASADVPAPRAYRSRTLTIVVTGVVVLAACAGLWAWKQRATRAHALVTSPAPEQPSLLQRAAYYANIGQRDNNERAVELFEQALKEQPGNVEAQVGLSRAYSARVCLFNFPPVWAVRAQALAEQGIRAQPARAAAHAALGYSHDCRGRIGDALAGYERALALDPTADGSRASAAYLYDRKGLLAQALVANTSLRGDPSRVRHLQLQIASILDLLGYPQAAEARYRRSFTLYPDNVFSNIAWPRFLFRHGRTTEAQAALDHAMRRGTEHADLFLLAGELAQLRGDPAAALTAYRQAEALRPQASLPATLARLQAGSASPAWANARADRITRDLEAGAGYPSDWLEVVLLREAAGDRAAALASLQRAVDAGYRDAAYLRASPLFGTMAAEPGFARSLDALSRQVAEEHGKVPAALLDRLTASP
ncbi:DNA-binding winged helix-turn-helix (wHTH) protein/tetratricopeptide (TPR) repeat protein [Pseudoxanthomonas japonensis]|uniref:winged helix-turn-helix domain-containing protein n=1 Tax=Pseudoxanthomonas japonensis TaxID=69284 RepID=UPI002855E407|nr:winged helix-turn-helix domain-containing protein [Pseudoxanthomonas japonensis]MDR7067773.1 DNA-binding winged helix-turn-helix (wHTH) protein/tetratricopeptide (TPR) repeat protein [Pseudoxanthomonas japonensis]